MSTNEADRLDLRQAFEVVFADERLARIAMEAMPPIDYSHLATRQDVAIVSAELRAEMADLKGALKSDMGELKVEFADLTGQVTAALALNIKVLVLTIMSATVILGGLITTVLG